MPEDILVEDDVTEQTFIRYAARNYININCDDVSEFKDDIQRFKYLKRLFNKFQEVGELKERLILNHIIILYNVFDTVANTRMLFIKLKGFEHILKPFLVFLRFMPEQITGVDGQTIYSSQIEMNEKVINRLREV